MKKHKNILTKSIEIYNIAADKYGICSKAVLWNDPQTQHFRFYELVKNLDLNSEIKTLLDIGCGNCELYKFLNFLGFRGQYTGYDINERLLEQARNRFSNINIYKKDIMKENIEQRFDYVVMSGLFNANVGQSLDWVYKFLNKMFSLCNELSAFNMISTYVNYKDKKMLYLNPVEILAFCIENLSKRVTLTHHNLPYNFTVIVFKNEDWISVNRKLP